VTFTTPLVDGSNPSTASISGYMTSAPYAGPEDDSSDLAVRTLNIWSGICRSSRLAGSSGWVSSRDLLVLDVSRQASSLPLSTSAAPTLQLAL
jgi:hypothetical protein